MWGMTSVVKAEGLIFFSSSMEAPLISKLGPHLRGSRHVLIDPSTVK